MGSNPTVAHAETYCQWVHRFDAEGRVTVGGGRFVDRLERRDGAWRIVGRRRVRGLQPWPGTVTGWAGGELKVLRARPESSVPGDAAPGTVTAVDAEGIVVAAGAGTALRLLDVQPESRRPMPASAFAAASCDS